MRIIRLAQNTQIDPNAVQSGVQPVTPQFPGQQKPPNQIANDANIQKESIQKLQEMAQAQEAVLSAAVQFEQLLGGIGLRDSIQKLTDSAISQTNEFKNLQGTGKIVKPQDMLNPSLVNSIQQMTTNIQQGGQTV